MIYVNLILYSFFMTFSPSKKQLERQHRTSKMLLPSSLLIRIALGLICALISYFIFMDYLLYSRMRNYSIRPVETETSYTSRLPCDLNPFCTVTVKGLMLDYPNFYILSPLAALIDRAIGISSWSWITPNIISGFHVLVAVMAGRCVASSSLSERRLGVLLFEFRTWLDDLDGHVARKRKHIIGEHSDVGSTGYLIDGICDALGCIALMTGVFFFLKKNPPRRGYEKLRRIESCIESQDFNTTELIYKRLRFRSMVRTLLLVVGHLLVASLAWNRYIALYQDLLESNNTSVPIGKQELYARQSKIMRSGFFWIVTVSWRLINFHSSMDYLLAAIFFDRLWEYMKSVKWAGYLISMIVVYYTEFHFLESYAYVLRGSTDFGTPSAIMQNTSFVT